MTVTAAHFNDLTPAEAERLAFLIEELAEAQQAACKILRHGFSSRNPLEEDGPSNREALATELGHVEAALSLMTRAEDLLIHHVEDSCIDKLASVQRWMHHQ